MKRSFAAVHLSRWIFLAGVIAVAFVTALHPLQLIYGIAFTFTNILLLVLVQLFGLRLGLSAATVVYGAAVLMGHQPAYLMIFLLEMVWIGLMRRRRSGSLLRPDALYWVIVGAPLTFVMCYFSGPFSFTEFFLLLAITASNGLFNTLFAEILVYYLPLRRWLQMGGDKPFSITFRHVLFHLTVMIVALPFLMNLIIEGRNSYDSSTRITLQTASNTANSIMREVEQWKPEDMLGIRLEGTIQRGYLEEIINRNTTQKLFDITIANQDHKIMATNSREPWEGFLKAKSMMAIEDNFRIEIPNRSTLLPTGQWLDAHYVYTVSMDKLPLIITVSIPLKAYQEEMFREYIYQILYMLGSAGIAAVLAFTINHRLVHSLLQLAVSTTNLPAKLKMKGSLDWPNSGIVEIDSLTQNFKGMSRNLLQMFEESDWMNQQLRASEEKLHHLAYYDSLTGLPNRLKFQHVLTDLLTQAGEQQQRLAVMFIDLNRFKQINDTLGHTAGDILLEKVAGRFTGILDESCSVFRLGGDEFVFVLEYETDEAPPAFAKRICSLFDTPIELGDSLLYTTISIGISVFPEHGSSLDEIVKKADMAMYIAKEQGTSSYYFFNQDMEDSLNEKMFLENGLRSALQEEQFFLVYQPKVSPATGGPVGFEALIRWMHPHLGVVPPGKFIPLAETSGMIVDIDLWALREACRQTKEWHDSGLPKIPVSVNLSAKHFYQGGLIRKIQWILFETGLDPQYLGLEITESVFIKQLEPVVETLTQLQNMGIQISIDDFGTGYSSLSQLQRLPISVVKLDRTFIRDTEISEMKSSVVKAIIGLAHSMGLRVVAEGIETEQERKFYTSLKCDELQGFYFSKPLESKEFKMYMLTEYEGKEE